MAWLSLLRDNELVSGDMLARIVGSGGGGLGNMYDAPLPPGIGSGAFSVGLVGKMNGAAGADPNHFSVQANGANLQLTIRPGWMWIRRDSGSVSFDPRCVFVELTASTTYTLASNTQGSTRVDQVCLRYDLTTPPDSTGSNIPSIYVIQGGAASALGAAPADAGTGALYVVLATVSIANNATNVAQAAVTDKRYVHPSQAVARMHLGATSGNLAVAVNQVVPFDTVDLDRSGMCQTGGSARFVTQTPGWYRLRSQVKLNGATVAGTPQRWVAMLAVNGAIISNGNDLWLAAASYESALAHDLVHLNQGDYVDSRCNWQGTGTFQLIGDGTASQYLSVDFAGF